MGDPKKKTVSLGLVVFLPKNTSFFWEFSETLPPKTGRLIPSNPFFIAKTFAVCRHLIVEIAK